MKLLFSGDIAFNQQHNHPYPFKEIAKIFHAVDYSIVSFDSSIGDIENFSVGPKISCQPGQLNLFREIKNPILNLANNHVLDCGAKNFHILDQALSHQRLQYFGAGINLAEASKPLMLTDGETTVSILACVTANTNPSSVANEDCPGARLLLLSNLIQQAKELRQKSDFVCLCLHWGEELLPLPTHEEKILGDKLLEYFDLIIGNHPHVIRGMENKKERYIYYSLGNTLFDDIRDKNGFITYHQAPQNLIGLLLTVEARKGESLKIFHNSVVQDKQFMRLDKFKKAEKQLLKRSKLLKISPFFYSINYKVIKFLFDKWTYRYEFRFKAMGVRESFRYLVRKI